MTIICCLSDNSGMMFNHRRQSKDKAVVADVTKMVVGKKLWMNAYSGKMFLAYGIL